jgi:transcriptional regulator with XRE-family HTH domain
MRPSVCRHVLVKIRDQLGLQQKELANLVGCSTSTIKRIELGSLGLSRGLARKISERLGVSMNYLSNNDLRKDPVTDSGEKWTRQTFEKLRPRDWGKMKPYDRVWKLLYSGILMSRYQEYRGMIETLPNPLEAAWKLAEKLDAAYVAFLREYPPAGAALKRFADERGIKVSLKHRDYHHASMESVIADARELLDSDRFARKAEFPGVEGLDRFMLTIGLLDGNPYKVREFVERLAPHLSAKQRELFLSLCGLDDETPVVIELPGKDYSLLE